ncbi:hypothetical protein Tco_0076973, partial [Tanacetum coccineum]
DYDDEYQGELQGDSQEDKLTTAMILLAQAISQKFSSPTNNRLRVSSNTKNQAVVQDGRVDIQTKNAGYDGIANKNLGRNRNQIFHVGNASDESNQIVQRVPRTDSTPSKANVEQMLLAMKDEAGSHLNNEENDSMLVNAYGEESLDELTASIIHVIRKTIIQTTDDDQIDSSIIFDDPYVENNGGTSNHDSIAQEENHKIQMLAYNVKREAKKQKRVNNELKKQKYLLQQELETFKDRVEIFEAQTVQCSKYKETSDDLKRELQNDKDTIDRL